jgi:hypothetical protein
MFENRYFKIDSTTRYVVAITIGQAPRPGVEYVAQTPETASVRPGWSYIDGEFSNTVDAYRQSVRP